MCLLNVKEEPEYLGPARVSKYGRSQTYSVSPRRVSKTILLEERRPSTYHAPPVDPPPAIRSTIYSTTDIKPKSQPASRSTNEGYSSSRIESNRPRSSHVSRAASMHETRRPSYVEVDHEDSSSNSSSSSSSSEDLHSRTTHQTSNTPKSSQPKNTAPESVYSIHEREWRRERSYSRPHRQNDSVQYVNAPSLSRSASRRGDYGDPRASRSSYYREQRGSGLDEDGYRRRNSESWR